MDAYYHIAFLVADFDAAKEEMGAMFGVTWQPPRKISHDVRLGDGRVIHRESTSVWSEGIPAIQLTLAPDVTAARLDHVGRFVDDFPAAVARLEAAGCSLTMTAAADDGAPSRFAMLQTPFGFAMELVDAHLHVTPES
jgi:hypothetical protein